MFTQEELLEYPDYLLTKYQNEIYRQLTNYIEKNKLSQQDVANKMGVSNAYVSQILNGNFNFTLKKLIELSLFIGKVPDFEFVPPHVYFKREEDRNKDGYEAGIEKIKIIEKTFFVPIETPVSTTEYPNFMTHIGKMTVKTFNVDSQTLSII